MNTIETIKVRIQSQINRIEANEMYPAFCLNGQVSGLNQALDIILAVESDTNQAPVGYKCSDDGKHFYGYLDKRCRYCTPVYSMDEFERLEKR